MQVQVLSENLQKKLTFISHAVAARSDLPILHNVLLQAKDAKLFLSATDLEIGLQAEIPATITREGAITVPAKVFTELVSSLPAETVTLQTQDNTLAVATKKVKSKIQTMPVDEFPNLYEEKGEAQVQFDAKTMRSDFTKVLFAASVDVGRPALSGILIKKEAQGLLLVATDGYRLSLKHHKIPMKSNKEETQPLLIPARILREMLAIKQDDASVFLSISKKNNQVLFFLKDAVVVGRLIEADFPKYEKIIPTDFGTRVHFDRQEMQKAVKTCAIFARETANIIRLSFKKDMIVVSANTPSVGENSVEVEATLKGEENEIAFNARYLQDLLANVEENDMVFEMTGPLNPGAFKLKDDDSFLHIIMPIRVQE